MTLVQTTSVSCVNFVKYYGSDIRVVSKIVIAITYNYFNKNSGTVIEYFNWESFIIDSNTDDKVSFEMQ